MKEREIGNESPSRRRDSRTAIATEGQAEIETTGQDGSGNRGGRGAGSAAPPRAPHEAASKRRSTYKPRYVREGERLTPRELEILTLVASGETTPAIARRLGIAQNTIKTHLTSVYRKTGATNRVQATRHYLERYAASVGGGAPGDETRVPQAPPPFGPSCL